jgi:hypothetical protein
MTRGRNDLSTWVVRILSRCNRENVSSSRLQEVEDGAESATSISFVMKKMHVTPGEEVQLPTEKPLREQVCEDG